MKPVYAFANIFEKLGLGSEYIGNFTNVIRLSVKSLGGSLLNYIYFYIY